MRVSTWCDFFAGKPGLPKVDLHPGMPVDEVYSEWEPGDYWYERQCSANRRLPQGVPIIAERDERRLRLLRSTAESILWESSITLRPSCMSQAEFEFGDAFTTSGISGPSIAFRKWWTSSRPKALRWRTRRGDMLQDVPAARMSARKWADEIRRRVGPREAIYLCTDDDAFARDVVSRLGDFRLLRLEKQAQPIDQAFIEFLCLSRATRVVGTVMSSFSQESARFSGIQFEFCRSRGHELLGNVVSALRWAKKRSTSRQSALSPLNPA